MNALIVHGIGLANIISISFIARCLIEILRYISIYIIIQLLYFVTAILYLVCIAVPGAK